MKKTANIHLTRHYHYDSDYEEWCVGDFVVWEDEPEWEVMQISHIRAWSEDVFWFIDGEADAGMTSWYNLLRRT